MYEVKDFNNLWIKVNTETKGYVNIKHKEFCKNSADFEYTAIKESYRYADNKVNYWNQLKIIILKNGKNYMSFNRNYPSVPHLAYAKMRNGKEYIITSGDYQCLTIVNLTEKKIESYCLGDYDKGWGFCPTSIDVEKNEDGTIDLRIEGCYWGGEDQWFKIERISNLDKFEFPVDLEMHYCDTDLYDDEDYNNEDD